MTRVLTLTPKQSRAKDEVLRWYEDPHGKQTFYFAGIGGTGKSTCVEHIVKEIEGRVLFAAFTGKAASVMRKKGCPGATTIHRLAYRPAGDPPSPEQVSKLRDEIKRLYAVNDPGHTRPPTSLSRNSSTPSRTVSARVHVFLLMTQARSSTQNLS